MTILTCTCGEVALELDGPPIMAAECHCTSCRAAAARLAPDPPVQKPNGGTGFVLHRKDRASMLRGEDHLAAFQLTPESSTRRVVASCCATPMWLDFTSGHWISVFDARWPEGSAPKPTVRTMTRDAPEGTDLSGDIPNARTHSPGFMARLLWAWVRMGFRSPAVADVKRMYDA